MPADAAPNTRWAVRACPDRRGKMTEVEATSSRRKWIVQEEQTRIFPK